jgi:glycosyltransferase involved in cell wall biosynthesis
MVKISIITPVYNGEKYLRQAINSVLAQSFEDWELIVIDDGSIDSTPKILDSYDDPRISRIRQGNAGESMARNAGLELAKGEYIAFLDADDQYFPNAIRDLSSFLDHYPKLDVVLSDGFLCDEFGNHLTKLSEHRIGIFTGDVLEQIINDPTVVAAVTCTMTRRSTIENYKIRFDPNLIIGPDWDFWIHLARYANFGYLDKITCMYRIHQTNITRTSGINKRKRDLVYGRIKIIHSDWFSDLSLSSRSALFYNLLINLLSGDPENQFVILQDDAFLELSKDIQARLWRQVGIEMLMLGGKSDQVSYCLKQSNQASPQDWKTRGILLIWEISEEMTKLGITAWRFLRNIGISLSSWWRKKPKPVSGALGPIDG